MRTVVKIVDSELPTVTSFKDLGSLLTSEGGSQADVNNRIRIGWMKWKEVSGVKCDRRVAFKLTDKVLTTIMTSNGVRLLTLCQKEFKKKAAS